MTSVQIQVNVKTLDAQTHTFAVDPQVSGLSFSAFLKCIPFG